MQTRLLRWVRTFLYKQHSFSFTLHKPQTLDSHQLQQYCGIVSKISSSYSCVGTFAYPFSVSRNKVPWQFMLLCQGCHVLTLAASYHLFLTTMLVDPWDWREASSGSLARTGLDPAGLIFVQSAL